MFLLGLDFFKHQDVGESGRDKFHLFPGLRQFPRWLGKIAGIGGGLFLHFAGTGIRMAIGNRMFRSRRDLFRVATGHIPCR